MTEKCPQCHNEYKVTKDNITYCDCWMPQVLDEKAKEWATIFYPEKLEEKCSQCLASK